MPSREAEPFIRRIARSWHFEHLATNEITRPRIVALERSRAAMKKVFIYNLNATG
jgi:hypothetical protein